MDLHQFLTPCAARVVDRSSAAARALVVLLCIGSGCVGAGSSGADALLPSSTCGNGYSITASARSGCRSPEEPGCATCCIPQGSCMVRSWNAGGVTGVKPWYDVSESRSSCPAGCAQCASCVLRTEEELCQLLATPRACDCAKIQIGIDPCFAASSCECYCSRYASLTSACPAR